MSIIRRIFGNRSVGAARRVVRAAYDAARTTDGNRRHWMFADGLSANAMNRPEVRRVLRNRARYECANNAYASGMVRTLANDVIGTGPRLQMLTDYQDVNEAVEREFMIWTRAVGLAAKLRVMRRAKAESGEAFLVLSTNPLVRHAVKLDIRMVEADRVSSPNYADPDSSDGIEYDTWGNPTAYHVLKSHPGELSAVSATLESEKIPADNVIHYYTCDRPEQTRGIPDITPSIDVFAHLRRFLVAVISAAEVAANICGVIQTDAPPDDEGPGYEPLDTIELEPRAFLTLPGGSTMNQVRAEQPATGFAEFKAEMLTEAGRPISMPRNVVAGDSSGYNYASGRLDHQTYFAAIRIDQDHISRTVLDRILRAWLEEAVLRSGVIPVRGRSLLSDTVSEVTHQWFWDGKEHVDPAKEANAQQTRLNSGTTTLAYEYARQGRDWEPEIKQRAREIALIRELGMSGAIIDSVKEAEADIDSVKEEEADA